MTKLTTKRFTVPVVIALAIAAVSTTAQAAKVDPAITGEALTRANAAPIEEVGAVAQDFGIRMANGSIKLNNKNAKQLGTNLTAAILAKPEALEGENRWTNKADEIAEAAAILAFEWSKSTNPKKFNKKTAPKVIVSLLKGVFRDSKNAAGLASAASPNFFEDVVGSVMLTIIRAPGTDLKAPDKVYKVLKKQSKKLAGKTQKDVIRRGLDQARLNDVVANTIYEDGSFGPIIDPETDTRNG